MTSSSIWSTVVRFAGALSVVAVVALAVGCADLADPVENYYHPEGWLAESSEDFHGAAVLASVSKAESCQTCHGEDYAGGTAEVACTTCHAAYPHEVAFGANPRAAHAGYMRNQAHWDLSQCSTCHGADYGAVRVDLDGNGVAEASCLTCHSEAEGPEACTTCHGDSATGDPSPPPDLYGDTATTERGVGAHTVHVTLLGEGLDACATCHTVPSSYDAPGHIDDDPAQAEIVFGGLAVHAGAAATYDPATGTCGSTYCHGGFSFAKADSPNQFAYAADAIEGNAPALWWTDVGTGQAQCGTCHALPPTGHIPGASCGNCHTSFPGTHIDGMINVFGQSR